MWLCVGRQIQWGVLKTNCLENTVGETHVAGRRRGGGRGGGCTEGGVSQQLLLGRGSLLLTGVGLQLPERNRETDRQTDYPNGGFVKIWWNM